MAYNTFVVDILNTFTSGGFYGIILLFVILIGGFGIYYLYKFLEGYNDKM